MTDAAVADTPVADAAADANQVVAATPAAAPAPVSDNPAVGYKEVGFHFRKDAQGNKRESFNLHLPVLTAEGIAEIVAKGGKELDLLLDAAADIVYTEARSQVNDLVDGKPLDFKVSQDMLDASKLSWEAIANKPVAERKGGGIPKEQYEAFAADYIKVMEVATGKTKEQVSNAATLLADKFNKVKTNKQVVGFLKDQLDTWYQATENKEEFADVYEFLSNKGKTLLEADEAALLANL